MIEESIDKLTAAIVALTEQLKSGASAAAPALAPAPAETPEPAKAAEAPAETPKKSRGKAATAAPEPTPEPVKAPEKPAAPALTLKDLYDAAQPKLDLGLKAEVKKIIADVGGAASAKEVPAEKIQAVVAAINALKKEEGI